MAPLFYTFLGTLTPALGRLPQFILETNREFLTRSLDAFFAVDSRRPDGIGCPSIGVGTRAPTPPKVPVFGQVGLTDSAA